MNLLFIGTEPSEDLAKVLLSNSILFEAAKRPPARGDFDLIAFAPGKTSHIETLKEIREKWPLAWIAVIVPKSWLTSTETLPELLRRTEKNEIWLEASWPLTFWFSLQSALQHRKDKLKVQALKAERRSLRRQCQQLTEHSELLVAQLEKDIRLASALQQSLLPKVSPEIPGVALSVRYLPAAGLGGDYYDIFEFGDRRRFGIIVADSKTHSMAASLLSVLVKVRLEEMKDRFPDSKSFVEFLNREIRQARGTELAHMSLLYGIFDRLSLTFEFTVAGILRPILWREGDSAPLKMTAAPALGAVEQYDYQQNVLNLLPGDLLIFHTDGLQIPLKGEAEKRILDLLKQSPNSLNPRELQNELMGLVDQHLLKEKLKDDLTLIQLGVNDRTVYLAPAADKKSSNK